MATYIEEFGQTSDQVIPDGDASAWVVEENGNEYIKVDTSNEKVIFGTGGATRLTISSGGQLITGTLGTYTGTNNVAIGSATTLGSVNNNAARDNIAIGAGSLPGVTSGKYNVAIGECAGSTGNPVVGTATTTGEGCVYIGWDSTSSSTNTFAETAIGYSAIGRGSYSLALGHYELGQTLENDGAPSSGVFMRHGNTTVTSSPWIVFERNLHGSHGTNTLVTDNTILGGLTFWGADGTDYNAGASIFARIDGTPSDGTDMPTEIVFATSNEADNDGIPGGNERMIISPSGKVGIGTAPTSTLHGKGDLAASVTGTFTATNGSATLTSGSSTAFTTEFDVGSAVKIGSEVFTVTGVTSATEMVLDSNFAGSTASGLSATRDSPLFHIESGDGKPFFYMNNEGHWGNNTTDPRYPVTIQARHTHDDVFAITSSAGDHATCLNLNSYDTDSGAIIIHGGGAAQHTISGRLASAGSVVFNEQGVDCDFRVESANRSNAIHVDASRDVVYYGAAVHYHMGTGSDTSTNESAYLADTNATLIIDFNKGSYGDVTLAADVTAIKFWNAPADGTVATVTVKIEQHASSAKTVAYSATVYTDGGSTAESGSVIRWSGGVPHTMSTGVGDYDLVQFTCLPDSADRDVYASVIGQNFS